MDTVSMLNKMSFYCQPILPLVYDESMSYYETLCKVVGQLNTTGDAVNKLNEGLTGEIADRQKGDILLDERLRVLEKANKKIHFLTFAGTPPHSAGLIGTAPTRSELRQWVNDGDMIVTLLRTTDGERRLVYAASCAYNAGNWADETSDDFNILVPIHTSYDADKDHAISQKIAKITIPPASASSLDGDWGLQFIEINTPSTSADGVVNFAANIFQDGHMECNLTPFEFMNLYAPTWANRNLCVAVNAKLFYDGYTRTSSIATLNSSNHLIRIAFERDYGTFIENGVKQLNKTIDYIIGNVSYNTWTHETIDSKTLDFSRYDGFQFTRGAYDVITTDDESTPNAVYAQYRSDTSGKIYQNLPVRLIDTVDNTEYWNGVFGIKDDKHMTFTFVAADYGTISDKMHVRMIELSADVNTTAWKYGAKVIDLPYRPTSYKLDVWLANETPTIAGGTIFYEGNSSLDFDTISELVDGSQEIVAMLHKGTSETSPEWSSLVYSSKVGAQGVEVISFSITASVRLDNGIPAMVGGVSFTKDPSGATQIQIVFSSALPAPSADGSDNGKVPIVNGTRWEMKKAVVDVYSTLPDTLTNPVQNKAITAALASVVRETIYTIAVTATSAEWAVNNGIAYKEASADRTFDDIKAAYNANKTPVCEFDRMTYSLVLSSSTAFIFASYRGAVANDSQYAGLGKYPTSLITINTTGVVISRTAGDLPAVGVTDNGKMLIVSGGEWAMQRVPGTTVDAELSTTSENPVQNKTVTDALNSKLPKTGGTVTGALRTNYSFSAGGTIAFGEAPIVLSQTADGSAKILSGSADVDDNPPPLARVKVARPTADDDAATKKYVDDRNNSPQFKGYVTLTPENAPIGTGVGLTPTGSGNNFTLDISDVNEDSPTLLAGVKTPTDADTNAAATVEYVKNKVAGVGGAPITIKLGTGNAATSTATFAEIKAALEAGKAPILDSATGTNHWFALNWMLSGSGSLTIQYGTFDVEGGGMANFTLYDVSVSSAGIAYSSRQFTTE